MIEPNLNGRRIVYLTKSFFECLEPFSGNNFLKMNFFLLLMRGGGD